MRVLMMVSLVLGSVSGATLVRADDDPVDRAANTAVDSKKDLEPPKPAPAASDEGARTRARLDDHAKKPRHRAHKKRHHAPDTAKLLHDPTDAERR